MNTILNLFKFRIGLKILVILLPLAVGLFYLSRTQIKQEQNKVKNYQQIQELLMFSEKISIYIHELQKARGLSIIYLNHKENPENKGKLTEQQKIVKQKEIALLASKEQERLQEIKKIIKDREDIEGKTLAGEISVSEIQEYYTTLIRAQLDLIQLLSTLTNDLEISHNLMAWKSILESKEFAGQERATVSANISIGSFTKEQYDKAKKLENQQADYLIFFNNLADQQQKEIFKSISTASPAFSQISELRKTITSNEPVTLNVNNWFNVSTDRIEQLKKVDTSLANTILQKTDSKQKIVEQNYQQTININFAIFTFSFLVAVFFTYRIVSGIKRCVTLSKSMAQGDFSKKANIKSFDEIGDLGKSFDEMSVQLSQLFGQLKGYGETLATASEKVFAISAELFETSDQTQEQSSSVAGATEQMSTNINAMASAVEEMSVNTNSVSAAAEEMSQNMESIAAAVDKMSVSINEIGNNARNSTTIAADAMQLSLSATETMNFLGEAAKNIGQVTSTIKDIAKKTDLLALNATIEAASAGEAGKGFTVVANEIKNLANQSAQATEDITQKINSMQKNSTDAITAINHISNIIKKINESVQDITQSVNEESKSSTEIASNIGQANDGVRNIAMSIGEIAVGTSDISRNIGEAATAANNIATNIASVNHNAIQATANADDSQKAAHELSRLALRIKKELRKFKIESTIQESDK